MATDPGTIHQHEIGLLAEIYDGLCSLNGMERYCSLGLNEIKTHLAYGG
jgi:hypothetical protein